MACSTWQNDRSLSLHCTKRWKHDFLMCNGLFHLAERQKPQLALHDKMETRLSDAQWFVLRGRTTEASCETTTFDFHVGCNTLGRSPFLEKRHAKTPLSIGNEGALRFSGSQNDRSVARNTPFPVSNRILRFWSEPVFSRSATRNTPFPVFSPLGLL